MTNKYAPKNDNGLHAYVVTETAWGRSHDSLVWERTLKQAKEFHGYTRENYTSRSVRRASPADLAIGRAT